MRICLQNKRHQAKIPDLQCENFFQKPISSFVLEVEHQIVAVPKLENTWDQFLRSRIGIPRIGVDLPLMTGKNVMPSLSKNVKIRGFPFHLRHIPFKLSVFHSWKSIKKFRVQGADFLSSWVRDQAMTERHARRNLDACSKRLRGKLEVWTLGKFSLFPGPEKTTALNAKFRLNASTTERSTLRLQLSCSRSCNGRKLDGQTKQKAVDFSYGLELAAKCISSMLTAVGAARGVQMDWSWTLRNSCKNLYGSLWESSSSHQKDHPQPPPNPIASKIVRFLNPSMPKCFFSTHALSNIHHQQFFHLGLGTCFLEKRSGFPDVSLSRYLLKVQKTHSVSQPRFPKRQGLMGFFFRGRSQVCDSIDVIFLHYAVKRVLRLAFNECILLDWRKSVTKLLAFGGEGTWFLHIAYSFMVAMVFCHLKISHYSWKLAEDIYL